MTGKDNHDANMDSKNVCNVRDRQRNNSTSTVASSALLPPSLHLPLNATEARSHRNRSTFANVSMSTQDERHTLVQGSHWTQTYGTQSDGVTSRSIIYTPPQQNIPPSLTFPCRYYNKDEAMSLINVIDEVLQILEED